MGSAEFTFIRAITTVLSAICEVAAFNLITTTLQVSISVLMKWQGWLQAMLMFDNKQMIQAHHTMLRET